MTGTSPLSFAFHPQDVMVQNKLRETVYSRRKEHELKTTNGCGYCHTKMLKADEYWIILVMKKVDLLCNCSNCLDDAINVDDARCPKSSFLCLPPKGTFWLFHGGQAFKGARTKEGMTVKIRSLSTYGLMAEKEFAEIVIPWFLNCGRVFMFNKRKISCC